MGKEVDDFLYLIFSDMKVANRQKALSEVFGFEPENSLRREMDEMCDYGLFKERQGEKKGLEKGLKQGLKQGQKQGENRMQALFDNLIENNKIDEMRRAAKDIEYAHKLIEAYGL